MELEQKLPTLPLASESLEDSAYNVGENSAGKNLFIDKLDEIYEAVIDE